MKKLSIILLLALFAFGFSSCAEDPMETDPVVPEITQEAIDKLQEHKSTNGRRDRTRMAPKSSSKTKVGS